MGDYFFWILLCSALVAMLSTPLAERGADMQCSTLARKSWLCFWLVALLLCALGFLIPGMGPLVVARLRAWLQLLAEAALAGSTAAWLQFVSLASGLAALLPIHSLQKSLMNDLDALESDLSVRTVVSR